ncbi:MAG: serine/threonine protein kinase, partial [Betaproteobacteria bacterium]
MPTAHAYEALTPDVVLDALSDLGLAVDGRLMALSSYENRVYQVMLDDDQALVAKFYRPERWSDAQILEEHAFAAELMAEEIPVVGPLVLQGNTLHHSAGFALSVSPRRGGRMPELDDVEVLEWVGRFIARIHSVGQKQAFATRPTLNLQTFAIDSRDWLLEHHMIPLDQQATWTSWCDKAIAIAKDVFAE